MINVSRYPVVVAGLAAFIMVPHALAKSHDETLIQDASRLMIQSKFAEALALYETILSHQRADKNCTGEDLAQTIEEAAASARQALPGSDRALKLYQEALALRTKGNSYSHAVAETLKRIAQVEVDRHHYPEAEKYFLEAMKTEEQLGPSQALADSMRMLAVLYRKQLVEPHPSAGATSFSCSNEQLCDKARDMDGRADAIRFSGRAVRSSDVLMSLSEKHMTPKPVLQLVLYKDGCAVFRDKNSPTGLSQVNLTGSAADVWSSSIARLGSLKERYDIGRGSLAITESSISTLRFNDGRDMHTIEIVGWFDEPSKKEELPPALAAMYNDIKGFKSAESRPWLPPDIEVELIAGGGSSRSAKKALLWPSEFAGPLRRVSPGRYSVSIDCAKYPEQVMSLFRAFRENCDILRDGDRYQLWRIGVQQGGYDRRWDERFGYQLDRSRPYQ